MLPRREDAALSETEVSFRSPFELHPLEEGEVSPPFGIRERTGAHQSRVPRHHKPSLFPLHHLLLSDGRRLSKKCWPSFILRLHHHLPSHHCPQDAPQVTAELSQLLWMQMKFQAESGGPQTHKFKSGLVPNSWHGDTLS